MSRALSTVEPVKIQGIREGVPANDGAGRVIDVVPDSPRTQKRVVQTADSQPKTPIFDQEPALFRDDIHALEGLPLTQRRALQAYSDTANFVRVDADVDYLGAVDVFV